MPIYIYKGLSVKEKKARLEKYMETIVPPEKPGVPSHYIIHSRDSEEIKKRKRDNVEKWRKEAEKEYAAGLDVMDLELKIGPHVFEKGKEVKVPDTDVLVSKFDALAGLGVGNNPSHIIVQSHTLIRKESEKAPAPKEAATTVSKKAAKD